jgi:Leucine Rich repeat
MLLTAAKAASPIRIAQVSVWPGEDLSEPAPDVGSWVVSRFRRCLHLMGTCGLREISLDDADTGPVDFAFTAIFDHIDALAAATMLTHLNLGGCCLDGRMVIRLAGVLPSLRELQDLTVDADCGGSSQAGEQLATSLSALCGLRRLKLDGVLLEEEQESAALSCSISVVACLSSLDLSYTHMGDAGAAALAEGLAAISSLVEFISEESSLSGRGVQALCPALAQQTGLTFLDLDLDLSVQGDKVSEGGGLSALGPVLAGLPRLRKIVLAYHCHRLGDGDSDVRAHRSPSCKRCTCMLAGSAQRASLSWGGCCKVQSGCKATRSLSVGGIKMMHTFECCSHDKLCHRCNVNTFCGRDAAAMTA